MAHRVVENVADYPRPPALQRVSETLRIVFADAEIARAEGTGWRVLETYHPPTYYLPIGSFADGVLRPVSGSSFCEWKGEAAYFDVVGTDGNVARRAAWTYPDPTAAFRDLKDHVAVYAEPMDACFVGDPQVRPQPGNFYGGWVTDDITGPIKGAPGTTHW